MMAVLAQQAPAVVVTPTIDWVALAPVTILAVGAILLLAFSSLTRSKPLNGAYALFTVVVAGTAMAAGLPLWARAHGWHELGRWTVDPPYGPFTAVGGAIGIDGFGLFVLFLIGSAVILGALIAEGYLRREGLGDPEVFVLMLLSATGGVLMAMANDLIVLFLALETLSLAVYVLAASHRRRVESQESGLKYFILGGFSSAFFVYGIAMIYGATGTTNLVQIKDFLAETIPLNNGLLMVGFALLLVGLGFKVAAVPFHQWSPDVYDGAPTPVTAFMASAVKVAAFAGLIRVFVVTFGQYSTDWQPAIYALAVLSMVGGAVLGIVQTNLKRALAYSAINHAGFILMTVQAATPQGVAAALFYLATYTFMVVGSFAVLALGGRRGDNRQTFDDYRGFSRTSPVLAGLFVVFLLGQAGVPFTSGFVAKMYAVASAVSAGSIVLAVIAVVSAVIAAMIYLRIIVTIYMDTDDEAAVAHGPKVTLPFAAGLGLAICAVATIGFGVLPGGLTNMADDSRPALVREPVAAGRVGSPAASIPQPSAPVVAPSSGVVTGSSEPTPP